MGQSESTKTSKCPNLVTPAKAGVQKDNLDSCFRRNDSVTGSRSNLKFQTDPSIVNPQENQ